MAEPSEKNGSDSPGLKKVLTLWNLICIGVVIIQPVAPMGVFGVISNKAQGHVVTTILIAMIAMLFTAISYGKMARVYPSAGSAYTFVGREIHPSFGYITGWSMLMDYVLNPLICVAFCSKAAMNIVPEIHFYVWVLFFAFLFTFLNLRGVNTSARMNEMICIALLVVVGIFFVAAARFVWGMHTCGPGFFTDPFYNPHTFKVNNLFAGTSIAVLTYIGFDAISNFSEEAKDPKRDILRATVLVCLVIGVLSAVEVYAAQLIWGSGPFPQDQVESAFALVSKQAGGMVLFHIINFSLLVANMGSGMGAHLAAGRLLYGMGRGNALPRKIFGVIDPVNHIPRNNIIIIGVFVLLGVCSMELCSSKLGGGTYEVGVQMLNFGALIGFMGVNASSIAYYYVKASEKNLGNLFPPLLGFFICGYLWLMLSTPAKIIGGILMAIGFTYGYIKTKGFRSELISFDYTGTDQQSN
jgi:putrescine importer